jgi:hypothetical protein
VQPRAFRNSERAVVRVACATLATRWPISNSHQRAATSLFAKIFSGACIRRNIVRVSGRCSINGPQSEFEPSCVAPAQRDRRESGRANALRPANSIALCRPGGSLLQFAPSVHSHSPPRFSAVRLHGICRRGARRRFFPWRGSQWQLATERRTQRRRAVHAGETSARGIRTLHPVAQAAGTDLSAWRTADRYRRTRASLAA